MKHKDDTFEKLITFYKQVENKIKNSKIKQMHNDYGREFEESMDFLNFVNKMNISMSFSILEHLNQIK